MTTVALNDDAAHHRHRPQTLKQEYILTFDLARKMRQISSVGLKTPDTNDVFYVETRAEIVRRFSEFFPGVAIRAIDMEDLAADIMTRAAQKQGILKRSFVVTTCPEVAMLKNCHPLEINRIIDPKGTIVGIGSRPGSPNIDEQISSLISISDGQPIVLVEDGVFTGGTLSFILKKLQESHVNVAAVVIGFAFPGTTEKIRSVFEGEIIIAEQIEDFVDWMPDHDFFPFTPNCGRVLGLTWNGYAVPYHGHRGESYAVPYLETFCDMNAWTSIPKKYVHSFSLFCAQRALELWEHIEHLNKMSLRMSDLLEVHPRINIPQTVGHPSFPSLEGYITQYLSETCHMMA